MDQSMWLCWIRWRNQRAKATHRIQFQPETKRMPQPSQQSQHHENINALRISTHATVTKHIRNSDQQASEHNPPLTRIPSTRRKSSTSPISKNRSTPIYMKKINPAVARTARTSPNSKCNKRTKGKTDQSQLNKRREITLVNTSYNARILNGISII